MSQTGAHGNAHSTANSQLGAGLLRQGRFRSQAAPLHRIEAQAGCENGPEFVFGEGSSDLCLSQGNEAAQRPPVYLMNT